ncbi:MAG: peptidoglycan editing factor PgeF [Bacillaceae bacterium]|nr:MAG: peptidoglycan editing factor PgeF [Bacillaceae bacterium]
MKHEPFQLTDESFFSIPAWAKLHSQITAGFTTRKGGFSKNGFASLNLGLHVNDEKETVIKNRKIIGDKIRFDLPNWVCADQVHDKQIVKVVNKHKGSGVFTYRQCITQTDGLYTSEKNILLSLFFADCVPIFFFSPKDSLIGVAHAGWRGTAKNIAGEMIDSWVLHEGVQAQNIFAAIGPSIGECCYVVNDDVIDAIKPLFDNETTFYKQLENGLYSIHLAEINKRLLMKKGVPEHQILLTSYCTSCDQDLFFSHRRDQGKTGRMMGFIGLKEGY